MRRSPLELPAPLGNVLNELVRPLATSADFLMRFLAPQPRTAEVGYLGQQACPRPRRAPLKRRTRSVSLLNLGRSSSPVSLIQS